MNQILLADDEQAVRKTVAGLLKEAGFEPVQATSGARAVALHRERGLRVAILDMKMPGRLDGLQAARAIRQHDPHTAIIAVTAFQNEYEPQDTDGLVDEWISKPVSSSKRRSELVSTVRRAHGKYHQRVLSNPIKESLALENIPLDRLVDELQTLSRSIREARNSHKLSDVVTHDMRLALVAIASGIAAQGSGISAEAFSRALVSEFECADRLVKELELIRVVNIAKAYERDLRQMQDEKSG